jgi:hypothetical protein
MCEDNERVDAIYESYISERKILLDLEGESSRGFDKAILTLSAAALGFSVAFVRDIAPRPVFVCILVIGWSLLVLSLLATLISLQTSQFAAIRQIKINDDAYEQGTYPSDASNILSSLTAILNAISTGCFVFGIFAITMFTFFNIPQ